MEIVLAQPRGFCAGVDRAIAIVERALQVHGAPIYVRHEIVHNKYVVSKLREKGSVFVHEIDEVPDGSVLVFSAHGVPKAIQKKAQERNLIIYDATCPLVRKVHAEVSKMDKDGYQIIMIGHAGHPEVEGTVGQVDADVQIVEKPSDVANLSVGNPEKVAYVSQTTISLDDARAVIKSLKELYPKILEPKKDDICYATQNRQDAVKRLAAEVDIVLVVGSKNSSNSNRLREVAEGAGTKAYLLNGADEIEEAWFKHTQKVGITAGASAPEVLVTQVIEALKGIGVRSIKTMEGVEENVEFPLPKGLWKKDMEEAALKRNQHILKAPFGSVTLHYKDGELIKVTYSDQEPKAEVSEADKTKEDKALEKYLAGDIYALKDWPIAKEGTDFRKKVWEKIREIPPGQTKTYGQIAQELGSSARAVGMAVGDNPLPLFVPCHRVVGKDGLRGFGHIGCGQSQEGIKFQRFLLDHEKRFLNEQKGTCVGDTSDSLAKEKQDRL